MLLLSLAAPLSAPVLAVGGPTLTGSSTLSGTYGNAIDITDLQISDTGNPTEQVRLVVSHGSLSMTTTTGLTFTGSSSGAQLKFSGTLTNVNAALATLHYARTAGSIGADTLEVSLVGANQVYNATTGHLYEYVTSDGARTWTAAKALADARIAAGANGYLATMTSNDENTFISDRLTGAGWMGASDSVTEGNWKWVEGPETGTQFWSGLAANNGTPGSPVGGQYNKWNTGEPNNAGNEDCGQFLSGTSGAWNDLPCSTTTLAGYVVEYGAPGNLPEVASKSVTLTITGATHNVATCSELQTYGANTATRFDTFNLTADIDCSGVANFDPLYQTYGFHGTLNGHNHKITNLTLNHPSTQDIGLFFALIDATVQDLTLESGSVAGDFYVGALAGEAIDNVTISNVVSKLNITANYYAGGLVGGFSVSNNATATVTGSSSTSNVAVTGGNSGGLIGYIYCQEANCTIERSFATGNVTGNGGDMGGLVGRVYQESNATATSITFNDVYARGNVLSPGYEHVGGLMGFIRTDDIGSHTSTSTITINRAYTSGDTSGSKSVGGLIGMVEWQDTSFDLINIQNTFAAGHVSSTDASFGAGLVGFYNEGPQPATFTNNYYDFTRTAQVNCGGAHPVPNCTGVNVAGTETNYFKNNHTSAPLNNWDFDTIWVTNPGTYPTFAATDDGDGITTADENAGPNSGDANNDGTLDSVQANVASFDDPVSGSYAVLESSCGGLFNVAVGAESTTAGQADVAYTYPGGLIQFVATGCTPGATATIIQHFFGLTNPAGFVMRKWDSGNNTYTTVPGATFATVTIGSQTALKAVYHVTDGSAYDQDGLADGNIVDPAGPAVNVLGVPSTGLGGATR